MKNYLLLAMLFCGTICSGEDDDRVWKSERSDYRDQVTGTEVWRLTTNPEVEIIPDRIKDPWSPDGSRILFRSKRTGAWHLFVMAADGTELARKLWETHDRLGRQPHQICTGEYLLGLFFERVAQFLDPLAQFVPQRFGLIQQLVTDFTLRIARGLIQACQFLIEILCHTP